MEVLPFGKPGFIVNTKKFKKKLEERGAPANYLRCLSKETYQVYRRDKKGTISVRKEQFVLKGDARQQIK